MGREIRDKQSKSKTLYLAIKLAVLNFSHIHKKITKNQLIFLTGSVVFASLETGRLTVALSNMPLIFSYIMIYIKRKLKKRFKENAGFALYLMFDNLLWQSELKLGFLEMFPRSFENQKMLKRVSC